MPFEATIQLLEPPCVPDAPTAAIRQMRRGSLWEYSMRYEAEVAGGHDRPELDHGALFTPNDPGWAYTRSTVLMRPKPEMKHNMLGSRRRRR